MISNLIQNGCSNHVDKNLDVLSNIISLYSSIKDAEVSTEQQEMFDIALNDLFSIIENNKEEQVYKNIGKKVNKFNINKYIEAYEKLDNAVNLLKKVTIMKNSMVKSITFNTLIQNISNIQFNIYHKITTYNKGLTA